MFSVPLCTKLLGHVIVYQIDGNQCVHSILMYHVAGPIIVISLFTVLLCIILVGS